MKDAIRSFCWYLDKELGSDAAIFVSKDALLLTTPAPAQSATGTGVGA